MDAIRRGMRVSPALFAEVCCPSLSPRMTAALFCARELTPADILAAVQFPLEPESAAERLRGWVEEIVSGFDAAQCEGLLMVSRGPRGKCRSPPSV